jgi:hypothetical protein
MESPLLPTGIVRCEALLPFPAMAGGWKYYEASAGYERNFENDRALWLLILAYARSTGPAARDV